MLNVKQLRACVRAGPPQAQRVCGHTRSEASTSTRVSAECERPERFTTSPGAVLREPQPSGPRRGSALHKPPPPSVLGLSVLQTRSDVHTLKTSLHAVGETGVTEWKVPTGSSTLSHTHPRAHTHTRTHVLALQFFPSTSSALSQNFTKTSFN